MLEVRGLRKSFSRGDAEYATGVHGVSFDVAGGEVLGLVGESGCGKTTLARCILGIHKPDAGSILFQGRDLLRAKGRLLRGLRREIQSVFQDPVLSLNPRMTVHEIVEEPLLIHRLGNAGWRRDRVREMLEAVELPPDCGSRYPAAFSGGQRQRIAIARALAPSPRLVVADEPVSALDFPVRRRILTLLESLREAHDLSILFITHAIDLLPRICTRAAVMHRGRLAEMAPVPELFEQPRHPYTRFLLATHRAKTSLSSQQPWDRGNDLGGGSDPAPGPPGDLKEVAPGHWVAEARG